MSKIIGNTTATPFNLDGYATEEWVNSQPPCITGAGAPTTTTEGAVGCFYMDTTNGDVYKCIKVEGDVYTWVTDKSNKIIDVEYEESNKSDINPERVRRKIEFYDADGNAVDLSDAGAREKLHTGIYRIKVKSTAIVDYTEDFDEIKSNSVGEDIVVQQVIKYDTNNPDEFYRGKVVINQYLLSGLLSESMYYRQATINLDGSVTADDDWNNALARFEHTGDKVSDISEYADGENYEEYAEYVYPNVKAVVDYVENSKNKSTVIDDSADDVKYPTTKAVKNYTEELIANQSGGLIFSINEEGLLTISMKEEE